MEIVNEDDLFFLDDGSTEWKNKPFTGISRTFYDNGDMSGESEYVNGLQDGIARYYYGPGKLLGEEHFKKNSRHGPAKEWYPSGQMRRDAIFEYGFVIREKKWDETGTLEKDFTMTEDNPLFEILRMTRERHKKNPS